RIDHITHLTTLFLDPEVPPGRFLRRHDTHRPGIAELRSLAPPVAMRRDPQVAVVKENHAFPHPLRLSHPHEMDRGFVLRFTAFPGVRRRPETRIVTKVRLARSHVTQKPLLIPREAVFVPTNPILIEDWVGQSFREFRQGGIDGAQRIDFTVAVTY